MTMNHDKKTVIHRRVFLYVSYAIAFSIPVYGRLLPPLILLLGLNWLIEGNYIRNFTLIIKEKKRLLIFSFSLIYLLYLVGLSWSTDMKYGLFDLEVKLSLFLFPLFFATAALPLFDEAEFGHLIRLFALGCITGTLIFFGHACYNWFVDHHPGSFYYTDLSWFAHASYFSMYLVFAVSNILYFFLVHRTVQGFWKKTIHVLMLLYLMVFIILLSSKAGLLILLAVILFYAALLVFRYKRWYSGIMFLAVALISLLIGLILLPHAAERISQAEKDISSKDTLQNSGKSTADRIMIWKASVNILKQHYLFGVGTGDVKDELMAEYRKENAIQALEQKLNAHNQYIQTFLALGIGGLAILILMIFFPALKSFRNDDYIYFVFLIIIILSFAFESMLETQAGVIFYAFFNTLLFAQKK